MEKETLTKIKTIINNRIIDFIRLSVDIIKEKLDIHSIAKNLNSMLIKKMLGLQMLSYEEMTLLKNRVIFKTVSTRNNGFVKESMSFPKINFSDMMKNSWVKSEVYNCFSEKIIVLFIFEKSKYETIFKNVKYLELSENEIGKIAILWHKVKELILTNQYKLGGKHGYSITNLPGSKENDVAHIRPHDQNANNAKVRLPNGQMTINYCFWLNRKFIENNIKELLDGKDKN